MNINLRSAIGNHTFKSLASKRNSARSIIIARALLVLLFLSTLLPAPPSIVPNRVMAAPGDPISSFGASGVVATDFAGGNDAANAVAATLDGRIVAAGSASMPGTGTDFALARYDGSGILDSTFGTNGKVTTDFFGANDGARSLVVQADGNIVLSGFTTNASERQFALAGYLANGNLNPAFGQGGKLTFDLGSTSEAFKMVAQEDGKLLVVGESRPQNTLDFTILRLNADGTLDTSFGNNGVVRVDFGNSDRATALAIDDKNIFVAGVAVKSATDSDFAIARLRLADGSLNNEFDGDGKVTVDFFGKQDSAQAIIIRKPIAPVQEPTIVVGGYATNVTSDFALWVADYRARHAPPFNEGRDTVDLKGGRDIIFDLGIQPDGDLFATGWAGIGANFDLGIVKWDDTGKRDLSWGLQGSVTFDTASGGNNVAFDGMIYKDSIVTVGQGLNRTTGNDDFIITQHENEKFFELIKRAPTTPIEAGEIITYTFEITNRTDRLYGFFLIDRLTAGVSFIENGNDGWKQFNSNSNTFARFVQVPAGETIFVSLRVRAKESGTIKNLAHIYQLVAGSSEIEIYASDEVEHEVKEPELPEITNVTRFGKNLNVTLSKSIDIPQSDAVLENAVEPQASCPVVLYDGVEQKTNLDPDNPSTVLIVKKGYKKLAPGQTVKIRVRLCSGIETDDFIYTRPL
jgi:uncharacterized delta-60 repeat protein